MITQHWRRLPTLFWHWILRPCLWRAAWWPKFRRARSPPRWPCSPAGRTRGCDRSRRGRRFWRCPIRWEAASLGRNERCETSVMLSSGGRKDSRRQTDASCRRSSSTFFYFFFYYISFGAFIAISRTVTPRDRSWVSGAIIPLNLRPASRGSFMTV